MAEPDEGLAPEALDRELAWAHASAAGELVWHRVCAGFGLDPKDHSLAARRAEVVSIVRDALFVLDTSGLDGAAAWLETERMAGPARTAAL